jgi:hypothetical protein
MSLPDYASMHESGSPVDLARYWQDMQDWQVKLRSNTMRALALAAASFIAGLIALHAEWTITAVVLIAAAAFLNGESRQSQLVHVNRPVF